MLEEDHRILAADRGAKQAIRVERRRRTYHPKSGAVGEQRRARLRVIDRATDVAAVCGSQHDRGTVRPVGPPAHGRQLVADLHVRRPDVVEELHLDHRLPATDRHADRQLRPRGCQAR